MYQQNISTAACHSWIIYIFFTTARKSYIKIPFENRKRLLHSQFSPGDYEKWVFDYVPSDFNTTPILKLWLKLNQLDEFNFWISPKARNY